MFHLGESSGLMNELAVLLNIDPGVELRASSGRDYKKSGNTSSSGRSIILQSLLIRDSMEMRRQSTLVSRQMLNAAVFTCINAEMHNYDTIFGFVTSIGLFL